MAIDVALPYRTDWREMQSVLDYCKGKGADRAVLESRFGGGESLRETLNALEQLGMIVRNEAGDVRLTVGGEQLAYAPDDDQRQARLVEALVGYDPYRFPLERAVADGSEQLDGPWVEHIWQVDMRLGQPRNRTEEARTCFFRLADEAGLGVYRRGVRGQTTRLDLADDFNARMRPYLDRLRQVDTDPGESPAAAVVAVSTHDTTESVMETMVDSPVTPAPLTGANARSFVTTASSAASPATTISMYVDMTSWDLERIERFLELIGHQPGASTATPATGNGTS